MFVVFRSGEEEIREIDIVTDALSAMQAKYDAEHKQKVKYKMMVSFTLSSFTLFNCMSPFIIWY
jgi:hypothetical protein